MNIGRIYYLLENLEDLGKSELIELIKKLERDNEELRVRIFGKQSKVKEIENDKNNISNEDMEWLKQDLNNNKLLYTFRNCRR